MINYKQLDALVFKVGRLKDIYRQYAVTAMHEQEVYLDGKRVEKGEKWGEDFSYANFVFTYKGGYSNPYLYVESGGVDHLLLADGKPFGMADNRPDGKDENVRCHKYISLKNIRAGAKIMVEAYASHTLYGVMPFDTKSLPPERIYNGIYIVEMDETVKKFTESLDLLNSYLRCMKEEDVRKIDAYRLYEKLFELLTVLPEARPNVEELAKAITLMEEFFVALNTTDKSNLPYIGVIGHSHLDTAWLWTVEETHHKAARTAANAVTMLKEYPDYKFIMSSAVHLDWLKKDHPALFEEIRMLVKEGKFEPNGASWVECDCNITDGESIIRQFLRGKRFLKEEFDYEADVFWLPDTFGYSAALPQIMQGCGVPYFMTTKLSWNDTNSFPYESFIWKGIDGSEVTVHFNTIHSKADPEFLTSRLEKRKNKHLTKNVLVAYGYGDGGGGPAREMVEEALKTKDTYPYAQVEHTTVSTFMQRLQQEELPVYSGELYLELHRGTLTTNHDVKRMNRKIENALKEVEFLSVGFNKKADKKFTDECYDVLLLNQFHDILPGTCIHEVYEVAKKENQQILEKLQGVLQGKRRFNTLGFARTEVLPSENGVQSYVDLDGKEVSIDAYAFNAYGYEEKKEITAEPFRVQEDGLIITPYYTAKMKDGAITSLVYNGREIAAEPLNTIRMYEDVPCCWDNWDVDADYERKPCEVKTISSEIVSCGTLELRIRTTYALTDKSKLTQDTVFYSFRPLITFESKLEWNDDHKFLKADFPTNITSSSYKSEIQFGYLERPTTRNTSEEQAKYEVCNHKWTDISEPRFGVALLNDSKYGISVREGKMGLSLLKSGLRPDIVGEKGTKYFNYALLPHVGGFTAESVVMPAYAFNRPPVDCEEGIQVPVVGVSEPNVILETVKFAEDGDGIVLRLYECERSRTACQVKFGDEYEIYECDMLEQNLKLRERGTEISLNFRPFEIKTLMLKQMKKST